MKQEKKKAYLLNTEPTGISICHVLSLSWQLKIRFLLQQEPNVWSGETHWLRMQIQPRISFYSYPFHKNLTDVILVWGDNQHLKIHTKCSYQEPYYLVLGMRLYSSNLGQFNKNLPPMYICSCGNCLYLFAAQSRFHPHLPITAVWRKGRSELSCAILESFNILCNLWSKIIHLRKSGPHIDIVVE